MIISDYLLFDRRSDFSQRTLNYFMDRLLLFLLTKIKRSEYPKLIKAKNFEDCRAAYDHDTNEIQFGMDRYLVKANKFKITEEERYEESIDEYKYCIPLSDVYHELTHCVQFKKVDYTHTAFLEAITELFVYILTGQKTGMQYEKESFALWYILHYILKLRGTNLFIALRDAITSPKFTNEYLLSKKNMLKLISKSYQSDTQTFYSKFKDIRIPQKKEKIREFWKELDSLHNIIFYKN